MRFLSAMALAGVIGVTVPAFADTISYTVPFSFVLDETDNSVFGPQFNPALGTLTSVSEVVSGTYTPEIFPGFGSTPTPYAALYYDTYGNGTGPSPGSPLEYYTLTTSPTGGYLTAPAQSYSFSVTSACLFCFTEVPGEPPFGNTFWMNIDVYSRPVAPGTWGTYDDVSPYSGTVDLTYTYTVPEPSSFAVLAFGAGLLGLGRVQRRRPSVVAPA